MAEVVVVGAGLAGLTAAICCARAGHRVLVLERYARVGGAPEHRPSADSTPLRPELLGPWLGIGLGPPQVNPTPRGIFHVYGKRYEMEGRRQFMQAVERGPRNTSLDTYLYELALREGVRFEFGWALLSQRDAAQLPPGSIVATGLHPEPYLALGLPFQQVYGSAAHGRLEGPPVAAAWFDTFAGDYCYFASTNGIAFALAFDRVPLRRDARSRFAERLLRDLGVELDGWRDFQGAVGAKRLDNPRLFAAGKILAGSLAGMQDPFFFFGVHASLISGRIAAMAVDDPAAAWDLFRRISTIYKYSFAARRLFAPLPHAARRPLLRLFFAAVSRRPERYGRLPLQMVPGFREVQRGQAGSRLR